jgi:hypothetical protein
MKTLFDRLCLGAVAFVVIPFAFAQVPNVETLKQVLSQRLQKLLPEGFTERQVLFQQVVAGSTGDTFQVTAVIRDYGPGYPANHYYGSTCIGQMNKRVFVMTKDDFGGWTVEGAMTVSLSDGQQCNPNPSAGASSFPLSSLRGTPAHAENMPAPSEIVQAQAGSSGASLSPGQWACYGSGGRLLIGLGFIAQANGVYTDLDRKTRGSYTIQGGTITFRGGHLDKMIGENYRNNTFELSGTSCQPFR